MIERSIKQELLKTINNFPVTGIIGPRQVGKTTLAKELAKSIGKKSIYIDLENPRDQIKLSDPVLFFESHLDKCVILDEIQLMPELFSVIRSMVDIKREASRYILLGSASPILIRQSSQSLAGRIAYIELSGFNVSELSLKSQSSLWQRGGFPDAYLATDNDIWLQWIYNFIKTYVERDLPALGLKISPKVMHNLWTMIAHSHGQVINFSKIGRSLEWSSTSIKKYIDFLENAFLIRQLHPYHANIKKRIVKSPKVFIRDSGILHYLLNITTKEDLQGHPVKGHSFEGFVIEQIMQKLPNNFKAYFYRTQHGAECDLVLTKASKPVMAIEIKYSSSPKLTKGNQISFDDIGAQYNYVITPNSDDFLIDKNTRVCSLNDFIKKYI
jgi:predicted AAA+ superfamily ATPase